jgi:hypothetical protein
MVFVAINVAIWTADDAETLEFGFATPTYRATVHVTALPEGFNEVVNVNIDNFDRVQDALDDMWEFWDADSLDDSRNQMYSFYGNFRILHMDQGRTPVPDMYYAPINLADQFLISAYYNVDSVWVYSVSDYNTGDQYMDVVPTSGEVLFFGTPLYTPTPLTADTPAVGEIIVYATAGPAWVTPVPTLNPATPQWEAGSISGWTAPDIVVTPPATGSTIQFDEDAWYIYTPLPTITPAPTPTPPAAANEPYQITPVGTPGSWIATVDPTYGPWQAVDFTSDDGVISASGGDADEIASVRLDVKNDSNTITFDGTPIAQPTAIEFEDTGTTSILLDSQWGVATWRVFRL